MSKLSVEEAAQSGFTHAQVFDYQDLQAAGDSGALFDSSNQFELADLPAGSIVATCGITCLTSEAGTTDLTVDMGTTVGDPDEYVDAADLDSLNAGGSQLPNVTASGLGDGTTADSRNGAAISSDSKLYVEINGTHANLTAGKWIAWADVKNPGAIS